MNFNNFNVNSHIRHLTRKMKKGPFESVLGIAVSPFRHHSVTIYFFAKKGHLKIYEQLSPKSVPFTRQ